MTVKSGQKAGFIPPESKLTRKAMSVDHGLGISLDPEAVARLESAIAGHQDGFVDQILVKLRHLRQSLSDAPTDGGTAPTEGELIELVRQGSYEIKGLGTTFGYPALTLIAKLLHDYVDKRTELPAKQKAIVAVHVDALYMVLAQQLTNMPDVTEQALVTGLATLAARFP